MSEDPFDRAEEVWEAVKAGASVRMRVERTWTRDQVMQACMENQVMPEDLFARLLLEGGTIEVVQDSRTNTGKSK